MTNPTPHNQDTYKDVELECAFVDRNTQETCTEKSVFTATDQKFFTKNNWGPPNACAHHRAVKKKLASDRREREDKEKEELHHAATADEEDDGSSSSGDTDYEDKCPSNYHLEIMY